MRENQHAPLSHEELEALVVGLRDDVAALSRLVVLLTGDQAALRRRDEARDEAVARTAAALGVPPAPPPRRAPRSRPLRAVTATMLAVAGTATTTAPLTHMHPAHIPGPPMLRASAHHQARRRGRRPDSAVPAVSPAGVTILAAASVTILSGR